MATPILIDCDPGHDDAIAILLALGSPEVDLRAVTAVSGNAPLRHTVANAIRVLDFAGRGDIPVAAGADRPLVRDAYAAADVHGETGLDGPELPPPGREPVPGHAVDLLARVIAESPAPPTLVAVGPLTNVALLLAVRPDAARRLERVVLMGGAIGLGNVTPAAEFNIWADPEAARRVFDSGLDVTMVGLDVTHQALVRPADGERLRAAGRAGRLVAELVDFYGASHDWLGGAPIHDAVAVAEVVRPGTVELARCRLDVDCESELSRGRTLADLHAVTGREANARVATGLDADGFGALLHERIAALA